MPDTPESGAARQTGERPNPRLVRPSGEHPMSSDNDLPPAGDDQPADLAQDQSQPGASGQPEAEPVAGTEQPPAEEEPESGSPS